MRLKSFTAKNTKEAMQMVREELGEDAIIVATREEKNAVGGRQVQITAAIERDGYYADRSEESVPELSEFDEEPNEDWLYNDDDNEAMVIEEVTETLLRHGVPDEVLEQIVSHAAVLGIDEPRLAMLSALESLFRFHPLPITANQKPFMMIGPPGSGKTLAVAKIAARSAMNDLNVAVITTDTQRAGGVEQLSAFTDLMDIELKIAKNATELKERILETKNFDQVIIDTAAANPFNTENIKSLAQLIGAVDLEPVLVIPANTHAEEAGETAQIFANIGATRLLPTRVDVSRRLGSLLTAAYKGGLVFADASATARVADGLSQLDAKRLTQLLMPRAEAANIHKNQSKRTGSSYV